MGGNGAVALPDFPVYGRLPECSECMTRLIGPQNHLLWLAMEPDRMGKVLSRVGQFYLDCAKAAIDAAGVNVKIVAVPSPQLFKLQDQAYQDTVITGADRMNSTYITNRARRLMSDWDFNPLAKDYAVCSDHDDVWREGGSLDEVCEDSGLDVEAVVKSVIAFAKDHEKRMGRLQSMVGDAAKV